MRPTPSRFTNPSGLIDKRLGEGFEAIEYVRENLDKIGHLSYYMESLFNLDRNLELLHDENVSHHILKDVTFFQGASAYEIALKYGFVGTEEEWLASLKGLTGDPGSDGVIDTITLNGILADIKANTDNIGTTAADLATAISQTTSFVNSSISDLEVAFNADLDARDAALSAEIDTVLGAIPSNAAITSLAQSAVNASLVTVNTAIANVDQRVNGANDLLDLLRDDLDDNTTAFNNFLLQNDQTIIRLTAIEAVAGDNSAGIIDLDQVTADLASRQTTLQAESTTHTSNITALQEVTSDSATQINVLQVANNEQASSITDLQTIQDGVVTDLSALQVTVGDNHTYSINTRTVANENATSISSLGVRTDDAETAITNLQTVTSDTATNLSALVVRVGDNESSIVDLDAVTTNQATSLSALDVRIGDAEGQITTLETTKADQTGLDAEALRIDSLESRTSTTESQIVNLQNTKADEVDLLAEATKISQLRSRVSSFVAPGIKVGANGTCKLVPNKNIVGNIDDGEIRLIGGFLEHDTTGKTQFETRTIFTGFEGTSLEGPNGEPLYLIWSQEDATARFSFFVDPVFFIAYYDPDQEQWYVFSKNSAANSYAFTPTEDDRILAIFRKETGNQGITGFNYFINYTNIEAEITTVLQTKADGSDLVAEATRIDALVSRTDNVETEIINIQNTKADQGALISEIERINALNSNVSVLSAVSLVESPTEEAWTQVFSSGAPRNLANVPSQHIVNDYFERLGSTATPCGPKKGYPAVEEFVYEITADIEHVSGTLGQVRLSCYSFDGVWDPVTSPHWSIKPIAALTGRNIYTWRFSALGSGANESAWAGGTSTTNLRFGANIALGDGTTLYRIHSLIVDQVGAIKGLEEESTNLSASITTLENTKADGTALVTLAERVHGVTSYISNGGKINIDSLASLYTHETGGKAPEDLLDLLPNSNAITEDFGTQKAIRVVDQQIVATKAFLVAQLEDKFEFKASVYADLVTGEGKVRPSFRVYDASFNSLGLRNPQASSLSDGEFVDFSAEYEITSADISAGVAYISFDVSFNYSGPGNDEFLLYGVFLEKRTLEAEIEEVRTTKADLSALTAEALRIDSLVSRVDVAESDVSQAQSDIINIQSTKADQLSLEAEAENINRLRAGIVPASQHLRFSDDYDNWVSSINGAPETNTGTFNPVPTFGSDGSITADGFGCNAQTRQVFNYDKSRPPILEVSGEFILDRAPSQGSAGDRLLLVLTALDENYIFSSFPGGVIQVSEVRRTGVLGQWVSFKAIFSTGPTAFAGADKDLSNDPRYNEDLIKHLRVGVYLNFSDGDGSMSVRNVKIKDLSLFSELETRINTAEAEITAEQLVRASEDTALATSILGLSSRTDQTEADIISLSSTKADDADLVSEAIRLEGLSSSALLVAEKAASKALPTTMEDADLYFTSSQSGNEYEGPNVTSSSHNSLSEDPTNGFFIRSSGPASEQYICSRKLFPYVPGRTYEIMIVVRASTVPTTGSFRFGFRRLSGSYASNQGGAIQSLSITDTDVHTYTLTHTCTEALYTAGARYLRAEILPNYIAGSGVGDGVYETYSVQVFEVTRNVALDSSITNLETTKADASALNTEANRITALTSRVDTAETDISSVESSITFIENTKADLIDLTAEANRIDELTSIVDIRPNLVKNSTFTNNNLYWNLSGFGSNSEIVNDPIYGPYVSFIVAPSGSSPGALQVSTSSRIAVVGGTPYVLSYDMANTVAGNSVYCDVIYYDANNVTVLDGSQTETTTVREFGQGRVSISNIAPANAVEAIVRIVTRRQNSGLTAVRRIKLEVGTESSIWTDDTTENELLSSISSLETTKANASDLSAEATRIDNLTTTVGNNTSAISSNATAISNAQGSISTLQIDLSSAETDIGNLGTDVSTLQSDVGNLDTNVGNLNTSVAGIDIDVSNLQSDIGNAETDIGNLQTDLNTAETDITNLTATVGIHAQTLVDHEGYLAAGIALRTGAGGNSAHLELYSLDSPNGGTSGARISADNIILDGTVEAQHMNVNTLSAISADVGVLRTATTGQRLEIRSDKIVVYDSSNQVRVKIGNLS